MQSLAAGIWRRGIKTLNNHKMENVVKSGCGCVDKRSKEDQQNAGPLENSMYYKLEENVQPTLLRFRNDSWKHSHHSGMKGATNVVESHFHVTIVSDKFQDIKGTVNRHRYIFKLLDKEVKEIHGFQLVCKTPEEWEKTQQQKSKN